MSLLCSVLRSFSSAISKTVGFVVIVIAITPWQWRICAPWMHSPL